MSRDRPFYESKKLQVGNFDVLALESALDRLEDAVFSCELLSSKFLRYPDDKYYVILHYVKHFFFYDLDSFASTSLSKQDSV